MSCFSTETEICKHCKLSDFQEGYGPRTLLICDGCESIGSHVECEERDTAKKISEEVLAAGHNWYCSKGCEKAATELLTWSGRRIPLDDSYTLEFASKYDQQTKGTSGTVDTAKRLLKQSFNPLIMDNGRDLLDMICSSYESPAVADEDDHYNFSNFRVVVLRKGAMCVSAAALRVFGTAFAELPFVATRDGYRRDGNLTRLMDAVESRLASLGVQYMIVPSMRQLLGMWRHKFGFIPLTLAEAEALDDRIVSPDSDSAQLLKKALRPRTSTPPYKTTRALRSGRCQETNNPQRQSEQQLAKTEPSSAACCNGSRRLSARSEGPAALSGVVARSDIRGSPTVKQVHAVRVCQQGVSVAAGPRGQNNVGACMSVPASAQRAAQPVQSPRISTAAQPAADNSAGKQSASTNIEGPFLVPELGPGWTKTCRIYQDSKRKDVVYRSPEGSTFRSMKQAAANAESIATKPASSLMAEYKAAEPSAAAMSKVPTNLTRRADPSVSRGPGTGVATRPAGQGVVVGLPVIPPATASVMQVVKSGRPSARPPSLPPGQLAWPPSTANAVSGQMPPPPPRAPRSPRPQAPESVRRYVSDLHEETLQRNETLANENARLRDEIEELKRLAREQGKPRSEAQSDENAHLTASQARIEESGQEVQAVGTPLPAAAPEAAAADAPPEAPEGSAGAHAAAESHQSQLPNSATGAQHIELPSTPVSWTSASTCARLLQALPDAAASVPSGPYTVQQQDDAAHTVDGVYGAAAALDKAPDDTLCTGAPTVIIEQSALVLAQLGPLDSGNANSPLADCGKGTHAAAEEAQEMDWEAVTEPDAVASPPMQGDCHACDTSAGEDSCGRMLASAPHADAASREKGARSQHFQAAEGHPAQAAAYMPGFVGSPIQAAADVHGQDGTPLQAAAEMQVKLGSVVELVSAVRGGFSPHDAAGALLHNLQDVLSEIQQDAAQIAGQLSGAVPARACPNQRSDGCKDHSAEPSIMMTPLLERDINAPGPDKSQGAQEQHLSEQRQPRHGHKAMARRSKAAQAAPLGTLSGGSDAKNVRARHSWPGAVQRVVRSVFSLGTARLAPPQQMASKSRQPATSALQSYVAVGAKKAQAGVESATEGIEEAQNEGIQDGRDGKGRHSKASRAEVIPCIARLQLSGQPASCSQGSNEQGLSGAGQDVEDKVEAADSVTEPEDGLTEATTAAADSSGMEAAEVLASFTHSQADTIDAMQYTIATQLAMPTDSHLSQPHAFSRSPWLPSQQPSQPFPDCETPPRELHIRQQPQYDSRAGGEKDSVAAPFAVAAAAATEAPRVDERRADRKRANEDGGSAAWAWALAALPGKRAKTTHTTAVLSEQVKDSKDGDAVNLNDCQSDTSVDAALQQTALFCDQLGSRDDD